jgi:hypothetical protein
METEQNKLENFQNSVLSVKSTVGGLIKNIINTSNAPILDILTTHRLNTPHGSKLIKRYRMEAEEHTHNHFVNFLNFN